MGKAEQQEQEAAGHIASRVRKQGVECLCSVSSLSYVLPKTPALGMSLPIFKVGLLTSVNLVYISLPGSPDCPISLAILRFCQVAINNVITGIRKCKALFSGFHLKEMFDLPLVSLEVFGRGAVQTVSTYIRKAALRGRVYVYYLPKLQSIKAVQSQNWQTLNLYYKGKRKG